MIIKIIPETESEKSKGREVILTGVKEYFVCGNRKDEDETLIDFHQWSGSHKYLIGSLHYFHEEINDQRSADSENKRRMRIPNKEAGMPVQEKFIKRGEILNEKPNIGVFEPSEEKTAADLEPRETEDDEAFPEIYDDVPESPFEKPMLKFKTFPIGEQPVDCNRSGDMFDSQRKPTGKKARNKEINTIPFPSGGNEFPFQEALDNALVSFSKKNKNKKNEDPQAGDFED